MHVLFATPTAGGIVKAGYAHTLFKAAIAVRNAGWRADIVTVDGSDVVVARNFFANLLLHRPEFTHLMMIDSDMHFDGNVVCRLLRSDKPVVGAAYAKRRMDLQALVQAARNSELAPADLTARVLDYNLQLEAGPVQIVDGMCRVQRLALGCAAIRRDAFEGLIAAGTIARLRPDGLTQSFDLDGPSYDFFSQITHPDGEKLSEDYAFCERWLSISGNEIWALIDVPVGHVGDMVYGANAPYLTRLRLKED
jgi:hypothetical protein